MLFVRERRLCSEKRLQGMRKERFHFGLVEDWLSQLVSPLLQTKQMLEKLTRSVVSRMRTTTLLGSQLRLR